ncbi:MAG: VWA domain-containing protein, partial [Chloroflexales bacterium]|nr:VWA domain-containing protein [Chloroflexales bacterium]
MALTFVFPSLLWLLLLLPLLWLFAWATRAPNRARLGRRRHLALIGARSLILAALILALAGAQVVRAVEDTAIVFLIDGSDSLAPAQRERALAYINEAIAAGQPADRAAVVVFGAEPAVERAAAPLAPLRRLTSAVVASRTNIAEAVQLGLALLPADAQKRIVLLSDGAENKGRAAEAARLAAVRNVPIEVVPLRAERGPDVLVAALEAPGAARAGQELPLAIRIESGLA